MSYTAPAATQIGHVHLRVAELDRAVAFYRDVIGLEVVTQGKEAAFLSAGGYHHHIALNTWGSKGGKPPPPGSTEKLAMLPSSTATISI